MPTEQHSNESLARPPLRFLLVALATLLLLSIATGILAFSHIGSTPSTGSRWIKEMMSLKSRAASSLPGERLLVIGGSSALFGVLAETLSAETGLPSANLALHNNISPDYLFHWARQHARRGDTVLLALEYNYYGYDGVPDMQSVDFVMTQDAAYFRNMPWPDRLVYASALAMDRINAAARALIPSPRRDPAEANPIPRGQIAYQPYSFNRFGDQTWNQVPLHTRHLMRIQPPDFSGLHLPSRGMAAIDDFLVWSRGNGVRIVATFPPFMHFAFHDQPRQRHYFAAVRKFYEDRGVSMLGSPEDFRYPATWFFDTNYHLNLPAARQHSVWLGKMLRDQGSTATKAGGA